MINNFVQLVGLPGSGKSTYLSEHYTDAHILEDFMLHSYVNVFADYISLKYEYYTIDTGKYNIISADFLKAFIKDYDPEHPELVHEDSVQLARDYIKDICNSEHMFNVILDGGGINNHYNLSIIEHVKQTNPNAKITTVFFDTPIDVCIERISHRERKVPIEEIYKKNQKLIGCLKKYKDISDEWIRVDYFTNKYLMLDMDGTIAAYGKSKIDIDGNTDFVNCDRFIYCKPVPHIIEYIKNNYNMENVYIITACPNSIAWEEKQEWLNANFPEIPMQNRLWVGNKDYKHVFIKHFALKKKWKMQDICIIDDFHDTLRKCTNIGINAIHPSNIDVMFNKYMYQA